MLDLTRDIESLTSFQRNPKDFFEQIKKTRQPLVLTVKGKAAFVVQDAASYQRLMKFAAKLEDVDFLRQSLEDVDNGRTVPLREAVIGLGKK
jgi:prevent-host-death family protein